MFNLTQVESSITAILLLNGYQYDVSQFNTSFAQPVDHKGQPQSEVSGGQIMLTLSQILRDDVYGWGIKPWERKDGEILFRIDSGSTVLKVEFFNAYCVHLSRTVDSVGGGIHTILGISAEEVKLNGISLYNKWSK